MVSLSETMIDGAPARVRNWTTREGNGDLKRTFGKLLGNDRSTLVFAEGGYSGLVLNDERREAVKYSDHTDL